MGAEFVSSMLHFGGNSDYDFGKSKREMKCTATYFLSDSGANSLNSPGSLGIQTREGKFWRVSCSTLQGLKFKIVVEAIDALPHQSPNDDVS